MGRRGRLGNHVISICFDNDDEEDGEFLAMNFYRYCRDLESGQVAFLRDPAELENMLRFGNTVRGKGEPTSGAVKVQQTCASKSRRAQQSCLKEWTMTPLLMLLSTLDPQH